MATVTGTEASAIDSSVSAQGASGAGLRVLARLPDVAIASRQGWRTVADRLTKALPDRRGIAIGVTVGLVLAGLLSVREHRRRAHHAAPPTVVSAPADVSLPPLAAPQPTLDSSARLEGTVESPHTASHTHAAPESSVR